MASSDLKTFLEDRLRALDPSIDLEPGSPAQVNFIDPVLTRLGTDPIETDIDSFLNDRFSQEFPDIYAQDPSVVRDVFAKPLIVLLEPFKREIQTIKSNQSLSDPTILSDEDAEALAANVFEERDSGGFSVGVARAFYSNPTNAEAQITTRFFTSTGLNFYPTSPVSITAEEMVFNRSGALYYFDIPVKAESEGADYNIGEEEITGADGLYGVLKVTNLREFSNGASKLDTPTFIATAREALTERSLVTRRGATARISQVFQTELRAVQIIGAKDPEMQRDILVAVGPGHTWMMGTVSLYGNVAFIQVHTIDGEQADAPVEGDTLFFYLDKYDYPGLLQSVRLVKLTVEEVLSGPATSSNDPYQVGYLVRWSGTLPTGVTLPNVASFNGGFTRKGTVRITSLPDVGEVSLSLPSGEVHVYGHTDVYVRPILQPLSKAIFSGLYDYDSIVERMTLSTNGGAVSEKNKVTDSGFDFLAAGVQPGDVIVLETTEDAGSYVVRRVTGGVSSALHLSSNMTKSRVNVRYRIVRSIKVDPFEPKIVKFPFGSALANDLQTTIGQKLLKLTTNDLLNYSAKEGDVIRVLSGSDQRDYTIVGFDSVLGGQGIIVDQAAAATEGGLQYTLYTPLEPVERPLVRVKEVMLLDSAQQSTGITVPPADPVALVPTSNFTSARVRGSSQRASGYVLPDLTGLFTGGNTASPSPGGVVITSDRRYSLGFEAATGTYKSFYTLNGSNYDYFEMDLRADAQGQCSWFVSTIEFDTETENFPPVDPKAGECLRIKNGPNKGSYLIKQVVKQKYKMYSPNRTAWVYFIQIYGTFPVDIFKSLFDFLNDIGGAAAVTELPINTAVEFPTYFKNLYNSLGTKLSSALTLSGVSSPGATVLQSMVDDVSQCEYEWGDPARGVIRSYFLEPVLFQQNTAESTNPTIYEFETDSGDVVQFRADPFRYSKQEIIPARLTSDSEPVDYPRDLDASGGTTLSFTDTDKPSVFVAGVVAGDTVSVHEEVFFHGDKMRRTAFASVAGSNIITIPTGIPAEFTPSMVGNLLFMEQGADKAGYRVVKYIDSRNITLDKALTVTTPAVLAVGQIGGWGWDGAVNKITSGTAIDFSLYINKFITIFGMDYRYQGSFKIDSHVLTTGVNAVVQKTGTGDFPATQSEVDAWWIVTDAPPSPLDTEENGCVLYGLQAARMYQAVPQDLVIQSVVYSNPATSQITVPAGLVNGLKQPYRIYRKNIRRVTPTEMDEKRDGPFCFFDTEVVSLDPDDGANLEKESYLTIKSGSYTSDGFRHTPDDPNLTYSTKESGTIEFPHRILPVGSEDSTENFLSLAGAPVQVSYEKADVVRLLQEFLDSPEDRVTTANMLARHFLPAYVSYDAEYFGGSAASAIAKDIISIIDTVPVETALDISDLQDAISNRGGNPVTPTKAMVVLHDWSRKVWLEFSENEVGGTLTKVPYNGTPRVSYFRPGPDVSGQTDLPSGERINLVRR